ncbi:MAG: AmmeMemoRadiSam system protein A [Pseudolabrys sp.]
MQRQHREADEAVGVARCDMAQDILPGIPILPMVVGSNDRETALRMGEILAGVLGKQKPLIVASSDLSHYPSERLADDADRKTLAAVASLDAATAALSMRRTLGEHSGDLATCACGEGPILTAMAAARRLGARRGIVLSYANSGDTVFGEPGRVVGYGAVAFTAGSGGTDQAALETAKGKDELTVSDKAYLLKLARRTLQEYFSTGMVPLPRQTSAALSAKRGAFVTLTENGNLRGCIGYMAEDTPLALVVARTTLDSALKDTRFRPVGAREVTALKIKISALTARRRVSGPGAIVVGRDGVVLENRGRRAVFLPEVAVEQGWDRSTMLDYLCRKAGLPEGCWKHGATFHTFQTTAFGEEDAP